MPAASSWCSEPCWCEAACLGRATVEAELFGAGDRCHRPDQRPVILARFRNGAGDGTLAFLHADMGPPALGDCTLETRCQGWASSAGEVSLENPSAALQSLVVLVPPRPT